jgi:hypothetical protein
MSLPEHRNSEKGREEEDRNRAVEREKERERYK